MNREKVIADEKTHREHIRKIIRKTNRKRRHINPYHFLTIAVLILFLILVFYLLFNYLHKEAQFASEEPALICEIPIEMSCYHPIFEGNDFKITLRNNQNNLITIKEIKLGTCISNDTVIIDTGIKRTIVITNCSPRGYFNEKMQILYLNEYSGVPHYIEGKVRHKVTYPFYTYLVKPIKKLLRGEN